VAASFVSEIERQSTHLTSALAVHGRSNRCTLHAGVPANKRPDSMDVGEPIN